MAAKPTPHHVNFVYALEGDVDHVDVFALAPTLLALGKLVQDSSRQLNPMGEDLAVNVRPFRSGSFIVDVTLFVKQLDAQQLLAAGVVAAPTIIATLKAIGLVADVKESVVGVLRKLRGRRPKVEEVRPGEYRYTVEGDSISVSGNVHQLIQNQTVVNNVQQVYLVPFADPRVTAVKSYLDGEQQSATEVRVTKEEAATLAPPSDAGRPQEMTTTNVSTLLLSPKRGSFDGDGSNWSFRCGGRGIIKATIRDGDFLKRVANGEIRPHSSDVLRAEVEEHQRVQDGKIQSTFDVLRVVDYVPGRPSLFDEDPVP